MGKKEENELWTTDLVVVSFQNGPAKGKNILTPGEGTRL